MKEEERKVFICIFNFVFILVEIFSCNFTLHLLCSIPVALSIFHLPSLLFALHSCAAFYELIYLIFIHFKRTQWNCVK